MSRTRLTLAALLVVALAGPAPAQQKGRKVAFLVGVGEFKHDLPDLRGAPQRDVTKLAEVLREGGFEVVILTDKAATKAEVEKTYKALIGGGDKPAAALGKADLLLVAICTHGFTM